MSAQTPHPLPEGFLFGLETPLLDITAEVDLKFLQKYGLEPNNAILAEESHFPIFKELVKTYKARFTAGGSLQNTLRVTQWILRQPRVTTMMGATGTDKSSNTMRKAAEDDGVKVLYHQWTEYKTGKCAVLITGNGKNRSLCAALGGGAHFHKEFLYENGNFEYIKKAQFIYTTGYFVPTSLESIKILAEHALENKKTFVFNLSATFVVQSYNAELMTVLPYVDILFGNETEAKRFSEMQKFGTTDVCEISKRIAALPKKNATPRIVIITRADKPVILVQGDEVRTFKVTQLAPEQIKDTNGAGDAFVGAFLARYIKGKPIEDCVKCGIWAASEVIQKIGCTFSKDKVYKA